MTTSTSGTLSVVCFMIAFVASVVTYGLIGEDSNWDPTVKFIQPIAAVITVAAIAGGCRFAIAYSKADERRSS